MKLVWALLVAVVVAAAGAGAWYWQSAGRPAASFRTAPVERGDLLATIDATGTVEPEEVIDVGAQVAGQIKQFGRDPRDTAKAIDYGTQVEEGTVLALLDDALFQARVDKARAQLVEAKAQVEQADADQRRAEADLAVSQAKLAQAERDWERAQKLIVTKSIADAEYEQDRSNFETARAALGSAQAAVSQAKAARHRALGTVQGAEADLHEAEKNLGYTRIASPVKGVIIDRRVNVGQTVVASLNAPSLFLIAKDLRRMQVWASVNEADIGHVHVGQAVRFTVDAYPGESFAGSVGQIRLNASMTQNVVTYTVVVNTDNSNGRLLPYMTANLQFEVSQKKDVLQVPNAALRYRPQPALVHPDVRDEYADSLHRRSAGQAEKPGEKGRGERATLWVEDRGFLRPVKVRVGLSDGALTEIIEGDIAEGAVVVTGEAHANGSDAPVSGGKK